MFIIINKQFYQLCESIPTVVRALYTTTKTFLHESLVENMNTYNQDKEYMKMANYLLKHMRTFMRRYDSLGSKSAKDEMKAANKYCESFYRLPDDMKGEIMGFLLPASMQHVMPVHIYKIKSWY